MFSIENLKVNATITPIDDVSDTHQINTPAGTVGIRAGEDRCWINSNIVTENSIIFANLNTLDAVATDARATETADGSFVLRLNANCQENVGVSFLIVTPV